MAKARKVCKDCKSPRRPANYPGPRCYTCHKARQKTTRATAHARHIEATYGITAAQYAAIVAAQGGVCAICRRAKGTGRRKLAVDHDHETGEVRGALCQPCNRDVLGHLRDSPEALQRAIDYLASPPARAVLERQ